MKTYYHHARGELPPLQPKNASRILEIGARRTDILRWLKAIYSEAEMTGVELNGGLNG